MDRLLNIENEQDLAFTNNDEFEKNIYNVLSKEVIESKISPLKCRKCRSLFMTEELLLEHEETCVLFSCTDCKKKFVSEETLKLHSLNKHSQTPEERSLDKVVENFYCSCCSKKFISEETLKLHFLNKHFNGDRNVLVGVHDYTAEELLLTRHKTCFKLYCSHCKKQFISEGTLKLHLLKKHFDENAHLQDEKHTFTCKNCSQPFCESLRNILTLEKMICENCKPVSPTAGQTHSSEFVESSFHTGTMPPLAPGDTFTTPMFSIHIPKSDNVQAQEAEPTRRDRMGTEGKIKCNTFKTNYTLTNNVTQDTNALVKWETEIDRLFAVFSLKIYNAKLRDRIKCMFCNISVKSHFSLRRHLKISHQTRCRLLSAPLNHACSYCDFRCIDLKEINYHNCKHKYPVKCKYCERFFSKLSARRVHTHRQHPTDSKCKCCGAVFSTKKEKSEHSAWHNKEEVVKCDVCDKSIIGRTKLAAHKTFHNRPLEPLTRSLCPHCGIMFKNVTAHMRLVHSEIKRKGRLCTLCGKYLSYSGFCYHRDVLHCDPKLRKATRYDQNHQCSHCGKVLASYKSLFMHRRLQHEKHLYLQCDKCLEKFPFPSNLKKHSEVCGLTEIQPAGTERKRRPWKKHYTCKHCKEDFQLRSNLLGHLETVHGMVEVRRFQCRYCPKVLRRNDSLAAHERIHTGERLEKKKGHFPCKDCNEIFEFKSKLSFHLLVMHGINEIRKFKCQYCPQAFKRKDTQVAHERIHTGERPFGCEICGQRFRIVTDRNRHVDRHRNNESRERSNFEVTQNDRESAENFRHDHGDRYSRATRGSNEPIEQSNFGVMQNDRESAETFLYNRNEDRYSRAIRGSNEPREQSNFEVIQNDRESAETFLYNRNEDRYSRATRGSNEPRERSNFEVMQNDRESAETFLYNRKEDRYSRATRGSNEPRERSKFDVMQNDRESSDIFRRKRHEDRHSRRIRGSNEPRKRKRSKVDVMQNEQESAVTFLQDRYNKYDFYKKRKHW